MLQIALGVPLVATKGPAAPEVETVYVRARALCQQVGETPQLFPVLRGLWWVYHGRAEVQTAHELGEQLLRLAQRGHDAALLLEAHNALGASLYALGEFASAREHSEQSLALYDAQQHHSLGFLYGLDPGVVCLSRLAVILWPLGYPDQAPQRSHEALTLAQELSHPSSLALALASAGIVHQYRRESQATQEQAEATMTLSDEQGFAFPLALGTMMRGRALVEQGRREEGIAQMRQGLVAWQATGAKLGRPTTLAMLAEAYGKGGQAEEGLTLLAEALAAVQETGERFREAELYRLKGELTLQKFQVQDSPGSCVRGPESEAEKCFLKAIEVARRQQAKSLELRAVMSLSRLWQQQGKKDEARKPLAEIYSWFTEGFDTADLKEAKALLEG